MSAIGYSGIWCILGLDAYLPVEKCVNNLRETEILMATSERIVVSVTDTRLTSEFLFDGCFFQPVLFLALLSLRSTSSLPFLVLSFRSSWFLPANPGSSQT